MSKRNDHLIYAHVTASPTLMSFLPKTKFGSVMKSLGLLPGLCLVSHASHPTMKTLIVQQCTVLHHALLLIQCMLLDINADSLSPSQAMRLGRRQRGCVSMYLYH